MNDLDGIAFSELDAMEGIAVAKDLRVALDDDEPCVEGERIEKRRDRR